MSVKAIFIFRFWALFSFLFASQIVPTSFAANWSESLQIHGFATQGVILSSGNQFFGESQDLSLDFTELGLNASIRPTSDLQFSVQALSRRAGEGNDGKPELDYLFIDYSLISKSSGYLGIRIGRIKNPLGFYNDTRDVAFTRPSIFLPQSIYFDRTRDLALTSDGLNFYAGTRKNFGILHYELQAGYPQVNQEGTQRAFLGRLRGQGGLEEKMSYISRLTLEPSRGNTRFALSGAIVNIRYQPTSSAISAGEIRFSPLIFSAQYNTEHWSLTSEYALRYLKYRDVGPANFKTTGESYYLQGTYRILPQWDILLRYDALFQDRSDRSGTKYAASASTSAPDHSRFAKDWTVGLRWDMTKSWMSRIEYHYVDGTAWLPLLDNPSPEKTSRYWNMLSLLVSYRF